MALFPKPGQADGNAVVETECGEHNGCLAEYVVLTDMAGAPIGTYPGP